MDVANAMHGEEEELQLHLVTKAGGRKLLGMHVGMVQINLEKRRRTTIFLFQEEPGSCGTLYAQAMRLKFVRK